jgi:hypothetical protein
MLLVLKKFAGTYMVPAWYKDNVHGDMDWQNRTNLVQFVQPTRNHI